MRTLFELLPEVLAQARPLSAEAGATKLTAAALAALALEGDPSQPTALAEAASAVSGAGSDTAGSAAARLREGGGSTCIACGIGVGSGPSAQPGFATLEEQRAHFCTDLHRYNLRRRVAGLGPLSEEQFGALLDRQAGALDEVGSLSGSESGSDSEAEGEEGGSAAGSSGPQFQFRLPGGERCAVWRCLLAPDQQGRAAQPASDAACLGALQALRCAPSQRWAILLFRGGHFAAAVFEVVPERLASSKPGQQDKRWEALAHKSFHRYVVRAGQGGKQSSQDASGKYARSAGSRLRRHNEAALERDIHEVLTGWRELLGSCSLVLVHAPSGNSQTLFGGEAPLLDKSDPRVRRIPFTTRRPTYSETKRVARVLASLYEIEEQQQEEGQPPPEQPATSAAQQQATAAPAAGAAAPAAPVGAGGPAAAEQVVPNSAVATAAEAEAAEAAARKKAEKRARQKARQKEAKMAESAANKAAAEEAARAAAEDEIGRAAAQAALLASRPQPKTAAAAAGAGAAAGSGKARVARAIFLAAAAALVLLVSRQSQQQGSRQRR